MPLVQPAKRAEFEEVLSTVRAGAAYPNVVAAEAITNVAKYAQASAAQVNEGEPRAIDRVVGRAEQLDETR